MGRPETERQQVWAGACARRPARGHQPQGAEVMSRVSNHEPEVIDFLADYPDNSIPPARPKPITPPANSCSAAEANGHQAPDPQPGQVAYYVESFLRHVTAGRFLGGPYRTRAGAIEYANHL